MTKATLVYGGSAGQRENRIASDRNLLDRTAVIAEGLPASDSPLESLTAAVPVELFRIAPGCPCCIGNLTMRVTLNRILKRAPGQLYISLASNMHLAAIRDFLQDPQYQARLTFTTDLDCNA